MKNQRLNQSPRRLAFFRVCLAVALAAITFLAITALQIPAVENVNDKFNHLLAFFVLAWLADSAFPGKAFWQKKALPLMGYGVLIECIQYFLPFREFSMLDMIADGAGLIVYRVVISVVKKNYELRITNDELGIRN